MTAPLSERLLDLLRERGVAHRVLEHPEARTSEEASRLRGTPLEAGAKALVCAADDRPVLVVVPAHRRLDGRAFRRLAGVRSVRMIEPDRVFDLVGAPIGAVPPFGRLFGLPTYADHAVANREEIAFNAGLRGLSVVMRGPDYAAIEQPILGDLSR
jgi:Ala-tRNA(Pro) deacylase